MDDVSPYEGRGKKKIQQAATDGATVGPLVIEQIHGRIAQECDEDPKVPFSVF